MGIAMGWGWGNPTESYARGNAITYNRVDRANQRLADGGSVYTLSAQPGSTIAYNYVSNQRLRDSPLYHDGGSAGFHDHHNVYDHLGCTRPATQLANTGISAAGRHAGRPSRHTRSSPSSTPHRNCARTTRKL